MKKEPQQRTAIGDTRLEKYFELVAPLPALLPRNDWSREKAESLTGQDAIILQYGHGDLEARRIATTLKGIASSISMVPIDAVADIFASCYERDFSARLNQALTAAAFPAFSNRSNEPVLVIEAIEYRAPKGCSDFVVDGLIPRGHVTLLSGHGGLGKTSLASTISALASCAMPFGPHGCMHRAYVTYVDLENLSEAPLRRLPEIAAAYGINEVEARTNFRYLASRSKPQLMVGGRGPASDLVETELFGCIRDAMGSCDLLIVDHIGHAFGGNHNDPVAVYDFLRRFADLANDYDCAVVLIGHVDKDSAKYGTAGNSYSGTAAWHNGVRNRLALIEDGKRLVLMHEKCNLAPTSQPIVLDRNSDGVLLPAGNLSRDGLTDADRDHDEQQMFAALVAASDADIAVPTTSTGWKTLLTLDELAPYNADASGRKRAQAALYRLARKGLIYKRNCRVSGRVSEQWAPAQ